MTPEESRRLALAYRAWHEDQPGDVEIGRAVRRMQLKWARPRALGFRLRLGPAFAVAVALIAVLAYATPGSRARITEMSRRALSGLGRGAEPAPIPPVQEQGGGAKSDAHRAAGPRLAAASEAPAVDPAAAASAPDLAPDDRSGDEAKERSRAGGSGPNAKRGTSWQDVNRALASGDDVTAAESLGKLERGASDQATRAKARLGLAQLAVGRGDCRTARRLARSVATLPGLDEKIVHRAHSVLLKCELR
jgi:hypothetical protein